MKPISLSLRQTLIASAVFAASAFLSFWASGDGGTLRSMPYPDRNATADALLSSLTQGKGAAVLDGLVAKVKANAVAKAGNPANPALSAAYLDDYLAKVDRLDDATRAQFGTDYAFIFQYLYPRVRELRGTGAGTANDLIAQLTGLAGTGGTAWTTGTVALSASEAAVTAAYREVLLRDPEAAGLPYWKGQVDSGTFTASTLPLGMACAAKDSAGPDGTNAKAWLARTGKSCIAATTDGANGGGFVCGTSTVTGRDPDTNVYQTVVGEDGKCWFKSNLGTSHVATTSNDPDSRGWLYQWGRFTDGHQLPTSETTTIPSSSDDPGHPDLIDHAEIVKSHNNTNGDYEWSYYDWRIPQNNALWRGVNGKNNPCPIGWKVPSKDEWLSFIDAICLKKYGTGDHMCNKKRDSSRWEITLNSANKDDIFNSALKISAENYKMSGFWTSTSEAAYAWPESYRSACLVFASSSHWQNTWLYEMDQRPRTGALAVRCIKN